MLSHKPALMLFAGLVCALLSATGPVHAEVASGDGYTPLFLADQTSYDGGDDLASLTGLRQAGWDFSLWAWFGYYHSDQSEYRNFWSGEIELDVTKTFGKVFTLAVDGEVINYDDITRAQLEQVFGSLLLSRDKGIVLTAGKFNAPFGLEARDFWDRYTATPSLVFMSQPQDLRGVMLTAPLGETHVTLKPFIVSGFADEDYVPGWPSMGLMADYRPTPRLDIAATGWIGPGIEWAQPNYYGYTWGSSAAQIAHGQQYENFELLNGWWSPEWKTAYEGILYFVNLHALVKPTRDLTLGAEFVYGDSEVQETSNHWVAAMMLANFDIDDRLRVFGMYSWLDDRDWLVFPEIQRRQEVNVGLGYRLNRHIEFRGEYRHDFSDAVPDVDTVSVHVSVGY